jgi:hypothetical protein
MRKSQRGFMSFITMRLVTPKKTIQKKNPKPRKKKTPKPKILKIEEAKFMETNAHGVHTKA